MLGLYATPIFMKLLCVRFTRKKEFIFLSTETLCSILLSRLQYSRQGSQINWVYFRVSETSIQFLVPIPFRLFLPGNTIEIGAELDNLKQALSDKAAGKPQQNSWNRESASSKQRKPSRFYFWNLLCFVQNEPIFHEAILRRNKTWLVFMSHC